MFRKLWPHLGDNKIKNFDLKQLLFRAIAKEQEAASLYQSYAKVSKDEAVKLLLVELVLEENKHQKLLESLLQNKAKRPSQRKNLVDLKLTDHIQVGPVTKDSDDKHLLLHAIKQEIAARQFYLDNKEHADSDKLKYFLDYLADEELYHKIKLQTLYEQLYLQED